MQKGKIFVVGLGPGSPEDITPAVMQAVRESNVVVGYKYYFQFIEPYLSPDTRCIDTGMKKEVARAEQAFDFAEQGNAVCVISSGDAGIYGMTPLIFEMKKQRNSTVEIIALPGISAFNKAAALLGAPIGHDFCVISLSDLMTPWEVIERRIVAAAQADFVTAVYNPKSEGRYWQIYRMQEIFLQYRSPDTPIGYVRQAGREEQEIVITTLGTIDLEAIDMFTVLIIGNSQSYSFGQYIITPRGYYRTEEKEEAKNLGQEIMIESFRTIERELREPNIPIDKKWSLLHAIHTTADFDMENVLYVDEHALATMYAQLSTGKVRTIITDVTMAASGIRKGALERMGITVKCYLSDERAIALAREKGITRSQAGIRIAVEEHPEALYVFGNAPTALMELCELIRKKNLRPCGIIAAPVGFVNVRESKHMTKPFKHIPKIIIEGRKGGSNLAATLTNSVLCFNDAEQLRPGRDV